MPDSHQFDLVGFGSLNLDVFYEVSESFVKKFNVKFGSEYAGKNFETFLKALKKEKFLGKSGGGQSANTVYALANMGFKTAFTGKVGQDQEGQFLIDSLKNVDTFHINKTGYSGTLFSLSSKKNKDRCMFVFSNANDTVTEKDIDIHLINSSRYVHFSSFVDDLPFQTQKKILSKLSSTRLIFSPGDLYVIRGLKALITILKKTHILFISEQEINKLTNENNFLDAAKKLENFGTQIIIVTLGAKGSYILCNDDEFFMKSFPIKKVIDTTGAGDVYVAGFIAGLLKDKTLRESAEFASYVAAKSITGIGRSQYPTLEDLKSL